MAFVFAPPGPLAAISHSTTPCPEFRYDFARIGDVPCAAAQETNYFRFIPAVWPGQTNCFSTFL